MYLFLERHRLDILIALLIILELAFMLYFHKGILPDWINEMGFTIVSILIGVVLLLRYYGEEVQYVVACPRTGKAVLE